MGIIAITGAGGYVGRGLVEHLDKQDRFTRILGTDVNRPAVSSTKFSFLQKDIRDHSLIEFWRDQEVDTMVHLAFVVDPIHDEKEMYDINVNGSLNILRICEELEIGHIIVASSGTAYGAWPDNPVPLKEDDPIRIFPRTFSYPHHKGINEEHFADFMKRHPDVIFNIVRPTVVYGPNTDNYLSRYFKNLPFMPLVDGNDPYVQVVHEEDVSQLFTLMIEKKIPGAFNVAGDGMMRISEVAKMIGKRSLSVPRGLCHAVAWLLWQLRLGLVEAPPGVLDFTAYPWVLDTTRAKELLGWKPKHDTEQTLRIMFETHGYKLADE